MFLICLLQRAYRAACRYIWFNIPYLRFLTGNYGIQSYQLHTDIKNQIGDVLELIRKEAKKNPDIHVQVRNRTCASITKRYLYERDLKKATQCLEDARKLLQKYQGLTSNQS